MGQHLRVFTEGMVTTRCKNNIISVAYTGADKENKFFSAKLVNFSGRSITVLTDGIDESIVNELIEMKLAKLKGETVMAKTTATSKVGKTVRIKSETDTKVTESTKELETPKVEEVKQDVKQEQTQQVEKPKYSLPEGLVLNEVQAEMFHRICQSVDKEAFNKANEKLPPEGIQAKYWLTVLDMVNDHIGLPRLEFYDKNLDILNQIKVVNKIVYPFDLRGDVSVIVVEKDYTMKEINEMEQRMPSLVNDGLPMAPIVELNTYTALQALSVIRDRQIQRLQKGEPAIKGSWFQRASSWLTNNKYTVAKDLALLGAVVYGVTRLASVVSDDQNYAE